MEKIKEDTYWANEQGRNLKRKRIDFESKKKEERRKKERERREKKEEKLQGGSALEKIGENQKVFSHMPLLKLEEEIGGSA
ncbi:Uncharacterized protein TCM_044963 [Theobroma cacao]|uniref:Uncharacterized protein n=1 Tax=Theobroma cacao TaxID=3641 RepID=A0A061FR00_THECC|nr:Uncharacterized protein TCM_044963 [Theobroma cacao]